MRKSPHQKKSFQTLLCDLKSGFYSRKVPVMFAFNVSYPKHDIDERAQMYQIVQVHDEKYKRHTAADQGANSSKVRANGEAMNEHDANESASAGDLQ